MSVLKIKTDGGYAPIGFVDGDWEYGGEIPLDLDTPVGTYNFAKVSEYKKVLIIRTRTAYNSTLTGNTWVGVSKAIDCNGAILNSGNITTLSNGYVLQYITMETYGDSFDDSIGDGTICYTMSSNNGNSSAAAYANVTGRKWADKIGSTHRKWAPSKDAYWQIYSPDTTKSWDGSERYIWYGIRR